MFKRLTFGQVFRYFQMNVQSRQIVSQDIVQLSRDTGTFADSTALSE